MAAPSGAAGDPNRESVLAVIDTLSVALAITLFLIREGQADE
jgi:hypothetical protein